MQHDRTARQLSPSLRLDERGRALRACPQRPFGLLRGPAPRPEAQEAGGEIHWGQAKSERGRNPAPVGIDLLRGSIGRGPCCSLRERNGMSLHLETLEAPSAVANPYLVGPYAPTHDEVTLDDLEVVGRDPRRPERRLRPQRAQPAVRPERPLPLVRRRRHGARRPLRRRPGRPTATAGSAPRASSASARPGAPLWKGIIEPFGDNPPGEPEKDTANTDVVFHRDRLLALWYRAGKPYALDPVTLETLGAEDFGGTLRCEVSAHAKVDERTGELMFFDYGLKPPYMRYGVVGPEGAVRHFVPIDLPGPRLPHDMAITERHSILMDLPLFNDPQAAQRRPLQALLRPRHAEPLRRDPALRRTPRRSAGSRPSRATSTTRSTPGRRATRSCSTSAG